MNLLDDNEKQIGFYTREFYPLNNFAAFAVQYRGKLWPTSEHAYQASKFDNLEIQELILAAHSPDEAYRISHEHASEYLDRSEEEKLEIMKEILVCKFKQHKTIQDLLIQTGSREIIEDSPVDSYWGWGPDKNGQNHLGKIWMELRDMQ